MNNTFSSKFKIDWVLTKELAIGTAPKKTKHLLKIRDQGVKNILSLCSFKESTPPDGIEDMFNFRSFPLHDHTYDTLPSIDQIHEAINLLSNLINTGPVYIHCLAGMERSPLICLGYLTKVKGLNIQQALDYMMQVHPGTNPLPQQINLLNQI